MITAMKINILKAFLKIFGYAFLKIDDKTALITKDVEGSFDRYKTCLGIKDATKYEKLKQRYVDAWAKFHALWTKAVGTPEYSKKEWTKFEEILMIFGVFDYDEEWKDKPRKPSDIAMANNP